jgi:hypothetical protein
MISYLFLNAMRKRKYPIMTGLIAMMRRGDITDLADRANCNPQIVTDVIRGRRNIATYPLLAKAIDDFIVKREQELMVATELNRKLGKVLAKLDITPPTDEDIRFGGRRKTQVEVYRMDRAELLDFVKYHKLQIAKSEMSEMDIDELRETVWEVYTEGDEEKEEGGLLDGLFD